ncbi:lipopolysaccharide assembly protein LapB [Granulicella sp. S190]|uniref:tetratricopeptide repeat protein n=1 Tax=Granulicella sp. S190 TaxID=1747226 RepID=UPI00131E1CCA|nr:tetratricopeptide repeat protein [Granulicella sp. S190]
MWDQLGQVNPRDPEPLAHMGLMESMQQHYEAAATIYKRALNLDPEYPGLQMNLGLVYFKSGDFPNAAKIFRDELRKQPGDQRLQTLVATAHFAMEDYFVAVPYFRRAASQDPQNFALYLALARSCLWSKQYDCVLDVRKNINSMNLDSAEADMLSAQALDAVGDPTGAIDQLHEAIRVNPSLPSAHFALGYMLWKDKQFGAAAAEFEDDLRCNPNRTQTLAYLGSSYLAVGEYQKAEIDLDAAAAQNLPLEIVHLDLGILHAKKGRKDEAADEFQKAIRLNQYDPAPRQQMEMLNRPVAIAESATLKTKAASAALDSSNEPLLQLLSDLQPSQP